MTAADHANTVRQALTGEGPFLAQLEAALAALDALQAKAETAETLPPAHSAQWWQEVAEDLDERLKAMRAERDAAVQTAEEERLLAEAWRKDSEAYKARWTTEQAKRRPAEQAAEQAHAALRQIAALQGRFKGNPAGDIARAALAAVCALGTDPAYVLRCTPEDPCDNHRRETRFARLTRLVYRVVDALPYAALVFLMSVLTVRQWWLAG